MGQAVRERTTRRGVVASNVGSFVTLLPPLVGLAIFIERYNPEGKAGSLGLAIIGGFVVRKVKGAR